MDLKVLLKNLKNKKSRNTLYYGHMGHRGRRFGAGAFFISSREPPYYNGRVFLLCSSDKVYKKHTNIKTIEHYQRASRSGGGCLNVKLNGKWI